MSGSGLKRVPGIFWSMGGWEGGVSVVNFKAGSGKWGASLWNFDTGSQNFGVEE